jgi:hypothetical protein
MFPLAGENFPESADELSASIEDAIREVFALPKKAGVTIKGGEFPDLKQVVIDLSGAKLSAAEPPPKPVGVGKRKPGPTVEKLEITGHPILYEQTKLDLDLHATGLRFDFDRDKRGNPLLVLAAAEEGEVDARIKKKDIEAVLLSVASIAAREQGVTIQDLDLDLRSTGPRSVSADVRVKAKKLMMSSVLNLSGSADVDDELNATLSDLNVSGEGIIGGAAAAFLQKHVRAYDGKQIPLMAFSLGDVTLRDLEIELNGSLRVSAKFGKQTGSNAKKKTKPAKPKRA